MGRIVKPVYFNLISACCSPAFQEMESDGQPSAPLRHALEEAEVAEVKLEEEAKLLQLELNKKYKAVDNIVKSISRQKKVCQALRADLHDIKGQIQTSEYESLKRRIDAMGESVTSLRRKLVPETGSLFARLFLGHVNVKVNRENERYLMKKEYEKFKGRTNPLLIGFGAIQLLFPNVRFLSVFFQVWLLYYYVTLSLREHILKVNGSNIKTWWLIHHYISILISISWLTYRFAAPGREDVRKLFLIFAIWQGVVQMLMHRYQQSRLYEMIATGKAKRIDVTGELLTPQFVPSLVVLLPFILSMQGLQFYIGIRCLLVWKSWDFVDWQLCVCGTLLLVLAVGNIWTTLYTYWQKYANNIL